MRLPCERGMCAKCVSALTRALTSAPAGRSTGGFAGSLNLEVPNLTAGIDAVVFLDENISDEKYSIPPLSPYSSKVRMAAKYAGIDV